MVQSALQPRTNVATNTNTNVATNTNTNADTNANTNPTTTTSPPSEMFAFAGAGTRYKFTVPLDMIVEEDPLATADTTAAIPSGCSPLEFTVDMIAAKLSLDPEQRSNYAYFECVG